MSNIILDYETDNGRRGYGDVIISTAIIKALAQQYGRRIDVVLRPEARPLLAYNPYVRNFYTVDDNIDSVALRLVMGFRLESHAEPRNNQPRVDAMAELFGVNVYDRQPRLYYPEVEKIPGSIGISIESTNPVREWRADYLRTLIECKPDLDWHVFGQRPLLDLPKSVHNHIGKLDLPALIKMVAQMERFVTIDSLFSHLTAALDIPAVVMYTEVPKEWRCSYYSKTVGLQAPVDCSPCWERQKEDLKERIDECYQRQNDGKSIKCVDSFTPEMIEKAINDHLL